MIFYKILNKFELNKLKKNDIFYGNKLDEIDGFIHLSKWTQIKGTIKKHYKYQKEVFVLKIFFKDSKMIKFEKGANNMLFPHFYDKINSKDILAIFDYNKIKKFLN